MIATKLKKLFVLPLILVVLAGLAGMGYMAYLFSLNGHTLSMSGDVQVFDRQLGQWVPVDEGQKLEEGDAVRTGVNSSCELLLGGAGETVVQAGENTKFRLTDTHPASLELIDGELLAALTRPGRSGKFRIKTPNGTCGVRGTGWKVSTRPETGTSIEVFEGRVKFGRSEEMYETEPLITASGTRLLAGTESTGYEDMPSSAFSAWNAWIESSSDDLSRAGVVNDMAQSVQAPYPAWQEGMSYASWHPTGYISSESDISIRKMETDTNPSWINIVTTWYQNDVNSTKISPNPDKTPLDDSLKHAFDRARELGLHTMLTPQVDLNSVENDFWRAEIGFTSNEGWDKWFESYLEFILYYAVFAEENGVDILNIGTELTRTTLQRPDKWIEVIKEVRKVYSGRLVYTANWFEEYREITFWEHLDYAGISAYFPLSDKDKPSYSEIKRNWEKWLVEIEAWQKTHGRPVIFPEIGYRSIEGAAREPWAFTNTGPLDMQQQYNCYKAAFETFWGKEWFYGMYWWAWRTAPYIQGKYHRGYTPNDKPAAGLIDHWYAKPDPHKHQGMIKSLKDTFMPENK